MKKKNILIISSTMRKRGNSEILAENFKKGAEEKGHIVEIVYLRNYNINFCRGCLYCQKEHKCVINDDAKLLLDKFKNADAIVFATPVYYYTMCGQLKNFLDRMNPVFAMKYNFKEIYLLASCADEEESAINIILKEIEGWISCFEDVKLMGHLCATNVTNVKDILSNENIINKAITIGKNA